jgi:Undecaprenyl-phosphate glucose phosphotransferase
MAKTDFVPTQAGFAEVGTTFSRSFLATAFFMVDVAVVTGASSLTGMIYHALAYNDSGPFGLFLSAGLSTAVLFGTFGVLAGEYGYARYLSYRTHLSSVFRFWNLAFLSFLLILFVLKTSEVYSRGWFILLYFTCPLALVSGRYLLVRLVTAASRLGMITGHRLYVFGGREDIDAFLRRYQPWDLGVRVVGTGMIEQSLGWDGQISSADFGAARAGNLRQAVETARQLKPDSVFIALPWSDAAVIDQTVKAFSLIPVEIHLSPERILERFEEVNLVRRGPIPSLQLARLPLSPFEIVLKRCFDIVFASCALLALSPLMLAVAVLIRLDSKGPALFTQRRFGFNQQPFRIYKFRTMRTQDDGDVVRQATRDDPRVTRIGRFLRRWNIDELPQLINVIKGDMSIVGPRPHAVAHDREFEAKIGLYARRHNVKPGITGWAQVHGFRGQTDVDAKMEKRVEFDLFYIDNWSLWLDLKIIAMTVFHPHSYRNAF